MNIIPVGGGKGGSPGPSCWKAGGPGGSGSGGYVGPVGAKITGGAGNNASYSPPEGNPGGNEPGD